VTNFRKASTQTSGQTGYAGAWDKINLGTRIDASYRNSDPFEVTRGEPHDDAEAGEPHDDAKAIARAVNALSSDMA